MEAVFKTPSEKHRGGFSSSMQDKMEPSKYKYIYGPVSSWRIGRSLGIDPVSTVRKTCTFDCVYCQAGRTEAFPKGRDVFVPTQALMEEIRSLPEVALDYITFAGNGEPTLAKNLGEMIRRIRSLRKEKIAVITNASLIDRKDVQGDLSLADRVEVKLDVSSAASFAGINRPMPEVLFENMVAGLAAFRKIFKGQLVFQVMFMAGNKSCAADIAKIVSEIYPDVVEINTPLRVSPVKHLSPEELAEIVGIFRKICGEKIRVRSVYEAKREKIKPFSRDATERRRGKENL